MVSLASFPYCCTFFAGNAKEWTLAYWKSQWSKEKLRWHMGVHRKENNYSSFKQRSLTSWQVASIWLHSERWTRKMHTVRRPVVNGGKANWADGMPLSGCHQVHFVRTVLTVLVIGYIVCMQSCITKYIAGITHVHILEEKMYILSDFCWHQSKQVTK